MALSCKGLIKTECFCHEPCLRLGHTHIAKPAGVLERVELNVTINAKSLNTIGRIPPLRGQFLDVPEYLLQRVNIQLSICRVIDRWLYSQMAVSSQFHVANEWLVHRAHGAQYMPNMAYVQAP